MKRNLIVLLTILVCGLTACKPGQKKDGNMEKETKLKIETSAGDIIVKLVNLLPVSVRSQVELDGGALIHPSAIKTVLTGDPKDKQAKPVSSGFELSGNNFSYEMPAYSFTVIRIHSTGNR